ncbi:MAG: hypothetical protein PW734_07505 [Verrucomicrobium sp.]|nr:hypothetical protein [Verrucomicrobium sp.]
MSLGKNYLVSLAVFAAALWFFLHQRGDELDHLAPAYGIHQPQAQEEELQPLAPTASPQAPSLSPQSAPAPTAPTIEVTPRAGEGS